MVQWKEKGFQLGESDKRIESEVCTQKASAPPASCANIGDGEWESALRRLHRVHLTRGGGGREAVKVEHRARYAPVYDISPTPRQLWGSKKITIGSVWYGVVVRIDVHSRELGFDWFFQSKMRPFKFQKYKQNKIRTYITLYMVKSGKICIEHLKNSFYESRESIFQIFQTMICIMQPTEFGKKVHPSSFRHVS